MTEYFGISRDGQRYFFLRERFRHSSLKQIRTSSLLILLEFYSDVTITRYSEVVTFKLLVTKLKLICFLKE